MTKLKLIISLLKYVKLIPIYTILLRVIKAKAMMDLFRNRKLKKFMISQEFDVYLSYFYDLNTHYLI